jgi:putative hemolysin
MRSLAPILFAFVALLPAGAAAQATLNKCIDSQGKVTYSNLPCKNARETRAVPIDPAPRPDPVRPAPVRTQADKPVPAKPAATLRLDQHSTGKSAPRASARQCDAITDKLGNVLDKMDQARRKGYTQKQMDKWNDEVKELERKKQQSGCF